jgi:hypothetical protein
MTCAASSYVCILPCILFSKSDCCLVEKGLNVSFSKVTYFDIAPRVGLEPLLGWTDMQTFNIHRARIPTSLFKQIVADLQIVMYQFGDPQEHVNEEARSRFIAPVSCTRISVTFCSDNISVSS